MTTLFWMCLLRECIVVDAKQTCKKKKTTVISLAGQASLIEFLLLELLVHHPTRSWTAIIKLASVNLDAILIKNFSGTGNSPDNPFFPESRFVTW